MNRVRARRPAHRHPLSSAECRSRLGGHREGRIGYLSGSGWRSVVVSYCARADEVLIRLPDCNDAVRYAPGQQVTFDVCEPGAEADLLDEICVRGEAALSDQVLGDDAGPFLEPPWPDARMRVISLSTADISGCTETV